MNKRVTPVAVLVSAAAVAYLARGVRRIAGDTIGVVVRRTKLPDTVEAVTEQGCRQVVHEMKPHIHTTPACLRPLVVVIVSF